MRILALWMRNLVRCWRRLRALWELLLERDKRRPWREDSKDERILAEMTWGGGVGVLSIVSQRCFHRCWREMARRECQTEVCSGFVEVKRSRWVSSTPWGPNIRCIVCLRLLEILIAWWHCVKQCCMFS